MRRLGTMIVIAAAAMLLAGCTSHDGTTGGSTARPVPAHPSPTVRAADRFGILDRAFEPTDAVPDDAMAPDDFLPNSARRSGTVAGTTYWIAEGAHGGVCLVSRNPGADTSDDFTVCGKTPTDDDGAVVTGMSDEHDHGTFLVADGFTDTGSDRLHRIAPNVWSR